MIIKRLHISLSHKRALGISVETLLLLFIVFHLCHIFLSVDCICFIVAIKRVLVEDEL